MARVDGGCGFKLAGTGVVFGVFGGFSFLVSAFGGLFGGFLGWCHSSALCGRFFGVVGLQLYPRMEECLTGGVDLRECGAPLVLRSERPQAFGVHESYRHAVSTFSTTMNSDTSSPISLPSSLEAALIPDLPPSAYYIPNFITPSEEAHLLQQVTPQSHCRNTTD